MNKSIWKIVAVGLNAENISSALCMVKGLQDPVIQYVDAKSAISLLTDPNKGFGCAWSMSLQEKEDQVDKTTWYFGTSDIEQIGIYFMVKLRCWNSSFRNSQSWIYFDKNKHDINLLIETAKQKVPSSCNQGYPHFHSDIVI